MADELVHPTKVTEWLSRTRNAAVMSNERLPRLFQRIRKTLQWLSWGYIGAIVLLIVAARWCGERNWLTGTLIYFPAGVALLPLLALAPACFLFYRRLCGIHLLGLFLLFFVYQKPHCAIAGKAAGKTIRVVTNNIGQRKLGSMQPFVQAHDPEIMAFQEALYRERYFKNLYPGRFVAVRDEFILVSKWPIKRTGFVPGLFSHYGYAVAWFELEREGKTFVVYNVHLPTPRPDFVKMRGHGLLAELPRRGGIYSSKIRSEYRQSMEERAEEGEKLAHYLEQETRPYIVLGDFNMPDTGYLHGVFASELTDVFAAKGNGYGLTFPGFTRNPLSLFGPWLRIDYIFTGKAFRPLSCEVEKWQDAQHLAIAAELEVVNDN